ncbi:transposase [Geoalkalibacter halelectricus]
MPLWGGLRLVKEQWNGILVWFDSQISNGFLEAVNDLIQAAKRFC